MALKKGSRVTWTNGKGKSYCGHIVGVVQPGNLPNPKYPLSKVPEGAGRDHRSYVVWADNGRYFWPLVKYLVEVK